MKAEYRPKTPIFKNHLTLGKLYTVLDTKCMSGDKAAQQYSENIRKYLNYRRLTNRREWKVFYRYLRWQNRAKGTKGQCTEI